MSRRLCGSFFVVPCFILASFCFHSLERAQVQIMCRGAMCSGARSKTCYFTCRLRRLLRPIWCHAVTMEIHSVSEIRKGNGFRLGEIKVP